MNIWQKTACCVWAFLLLFTLVLPVSFAAEVQIPIKAATATSNHGSYPPSNAIDGITTTRWQHLSFDLKPAITFDLGKKTAFNKLVVMPTGASVVNKYTIEAADNAAMTQNRVVLASGTVIEDNNIFTFKTVSRRYIRYSVTEKDGTIGLFEFQVFHSTPSAIRFTEKMPDAAIPLMGEENREVPLPEVEVLDDSGNPIDGTNYDLDYSLNTSEGVYIDAAKQAMIVTDQAKPGQITLSAAIRYESSLNAEISFNLFEKENIAQGAVVTETSGAAVTELTDGNHETAYSAENNAELTVDLGDFVPLNKLELRFSGTLASVRFTGAAEQDFSDGFTLFERADVEGESLTACFPRKNCRYVRISAEGTGVLRLCELEAYNVFPVRIESPYSLYEAYIPVFGKEAAEIPPPDVRVVDIYGDEVYEELGGLNWSISGGLPQGVSLEQETGVLTVDPIASAVKLNMTAQSRTVESITREFTVSLLETKEADVPDYLSYLKEVESAPNHSSYPPSNAVDGNLNTRLQFLSNVKNPYITVDFGEPLAFNSVTVRLLSGSPVKKATVRASNSKSELMNEESIIGTMTGPLDASASVSTPLTEARYAMVYFDEADAGVSILEYEVRRNYPAIIYAAGYPEKLVISAEEALTLEAPSVDVRDSGGVSMVIDESDYRFELVSAPEGVSLDRVTGAVTVQPGASLGDALVRVYLCENETIYNDYVIKLVISENSGASDDEALVKTAISAFRISDYTDPANTTKDFTLPLIGENGIKISWSAEQGQNWLKVDETGFVDVTRSESGGDPSLTGRFSYGTASVASVFQIHVPRLASQPSGGGGGGGGGGSGFVGGSNAAEPTAAPSASPKPNSLTESVQFDDIDEIPWASGYLSSLVEKKILNGDGEKLYPGREITREEFVKLIVEAFFPDMQSAEASGFSDVPDESWYAPYIARAVQAGVITGVSEDLFGSGTPVTRQDAVVILNRTVNKLGAGLPSGVAAEFSDEIEIAPYAAEAVHLFAEAGIVSGTEEQKFRPDAAITRAEAAKLLCMTLEVVANEN